MVLRQDVTHSQRKWDGELLMRREELGWLMCSEGAWGGKGSSAVGEGGDRQRQTRESETGGETDTGRDRHGERQRWGETEMGRDRDWETEMRETEMGRDRDAGEREMGDTEMRETEMRRKRWERAS